MRVDKGTAIILLKEFYFHKILLIMSLVLEQNQSLFWVPGYS